MVGELFWWLFSSSQADSLGQTPVEALILFNPHWGWVDFYRRCWWT